MLDTMSLTEGCTSVGVWVLHAKYENELRTGGVVVIAFVLHTKGPKFDPWSVHFLREAVHPHFCSVSICFLFIPNFHHRLPVQLMIKLIVRRFPRCCKRGNTHMQSHGFGRVAVICTPHRLFGVPTIRSLENGQRYAPYSRFYRPQLTL